MRTWFNYRNSGRIRDGERICKQHSIREDQSNENYTLNWRRTRATGIYKCRWYSRQSRNRVAFSCVSAARDWGRRKRVSWGLTLNITPAALPIDERKSIGHVVESCLHPLQVLPLRRQMLSRLNCNVNLIVNQIMRVVQVARFLQVRIPTVERRSDPAAAVHYPWATKQLFSFQASRMIRLDFVKFLLVALQTCIRWVYNEI